MQATVHADVITGTNVKQIKSIPIYALDPAEQGYVPDALRTYVTAYEQGSGQIRQTRLAIVNLPLTIPDANAYLGTLLWQFPKGNISILGGTYYLAETTTSAIASTINSGVNMSTAVGTATASNISLSGTMVDLVAAANVVTSTTINVQAAGTGSRLASMTTFDGTSTAKQAYLNLSFPTNTDIDADGTILLNGHVTLTWVNAGIYAL